MRSWVGIEVGKVIKNVSCVVMSVRVSVSLILYYQYDCIYYVAPPVKMGAWSITCVLRQQIYYYYYFITGNTRDTDE